MATAAIAWQQRFSNLQLKLPLLNMLPSSPFERRQRLTAWVNGVLPEGLPEPDITSPQAPSAPCSFASEANLEANWLRPRTMEVYNMSLHVAA
ncbi:g4680 [Coccomyxa elongata]